MFDTLVRIAKRLPLAPNVFTMRALVLPHFWEFVARSQNDEAARIADVIHAHAIDASFVEFGYEPFQFNCIRQVHAGWRGLLIDGGASTEATMRRVKAINGYDNLRVERAYLTRENLGLIEGFVAENGGRLGILSIDVDGVDYWLCEALMAKIRPDMLVLEYNASFGTRPITVPYDPAFDRHARHESGWYHGASITAFHHLLGGDYALVDVVRGLNLIYLRRDLMGAATPDLDPVAAWAPHATRDQASGLTAEAQFAQVAHLEFHQLRG